MFNYFTVCVLLTVAVSISAYDFKDDLFNEYLLEELQLDDNEIPEDPPRSRRDAEVATPAAQKDSCNGRRNEWKKDHLCCTGDKFDPAHLEAFKVLKKQCHLEVRGNYSDEIIDPFDCEKMQQVKEQINCISECFAKKLGMLDDNGELLRDAVLEKVSAKIGEVKWKQDALKTFVDKCLAEVKTQNGVAPAVGTCNRAPLDLHHCIWREFLIECPAELRVNTSKCNKIRDRLAKGDASFQNKRLLHHFQHTRQNE